MDKPKGKEKSQIPSVPKCLVWEQHIHAVSPLPLDKAIERVQNLPSLWRSSGEAYLKRADANAAELVVYKEIERGVRGWAYIYLELVTPQSTFIQVRLGVSRSVFNLVVIPIWLLAVLFLMLAYQSDIEAWAVGAALAIWLLQWLLIKLNFTRRVVKLLRERLELDG